MTNPFETAIELLTRIKTGTSSPAIWESCNIAIRVLDAATKVDKERLISLFNGSKLRHALTMGGAADQQMYAIDPDAEMQLRALLAALPGKGERGG